MGPALKLGPSPPIANGTLGVKLFRKLNDLLAFCAINWRAILADW
jgi:hypothetical protein